MSWMWECRERRAPAASTSTRHRRASRSSGISRFPWAIDEENVRVLDKLPSKLTTEGSIRVVASDMRSQSRNRDLAEERLTELVRRALIVPRKRKATRPTRAAKEARLETKKRHSNKKQRAAVSTRLIEVCSRPQLNLSASLASRPSSPASLNDRPKASRGQIVAAFASIYLVWGSTYLAIMYAVETIPPFIMGGARFLVSGTLLYAWARYRGGPSRRASLAQRYDRGSIPPARRKRGRSLGRADVLRDSRRCSSPSFRSGW